MTLGSGSVFLSTFCATFVFFKLGSASRCDKNNANEDLPEPYGPTSDQARGRSVSENLLVMVANVLRALDVGI